MTVLFGVSGLESLSISLLFLANPKSVRDLPQIQPPKRTLTAGMYAVSRILRLCLLAIGKSPCHAETLQLLAFHVFYSQMSKERSSF